MGHISDYLSDLASAGARLSEQHMCNRFADRILCGLLGYRQDDVIINPSAGDDDGGEGIPDISVRARQGDETFDWLVAEAKLDDELIRNDERRTALWADKRKYVSAGVVHFLWVSKRTLLVCRPDGELEFGVYLEDSRVLSPDERILCTTDEDRVREFLDPVSSAAADSLRFLELFREGKLASRYLAVTHETAEHLTDTLRTIIASLRAHFTHCWQTLRAEYAEYRRESEELEAHLERQGGLLNEKQRDLRRERLRRRYAQPVQLFEYAFPEFCEQQAYTRWEPESTSQSEEEALANIFRTNAAYVALGRLLFVRFAEDQADAAGEPLMARKISNGGLSTWRKLVGKERPHIGQLVNLAFSQAGSIFHQVFSPTPFDAVIRLDDAEFDTVLLRVLYQLNAYDFSTLDRDVLGDLYQKLLPRELRKKMGEFYTDEEVVEYILHRSGYVEACRHGAPKILDPACGSGTFLVRAAAYLIEGARQRGVGDAAILDLVSSSIHGLDINDFAVFIARVNLLFTVFDLIARTRRDATFQVHEANSLMGTAEITQTTAGPDGPAPLPGMTAGEAVRQGHYDFVVGNPPYVRAERIPDHDREAIQTLFSRIQQHNVDLAAYFVYRAIRWLAEDGTFCMIVPRAIADAGYAANLRRELASEEITVTELTPLDWACHELFDSDIVPVIVEYRRRQRPSEHRVSLVHGLRSRADIGDAAQTPPAPDEVPWEQFVARGPEETWPLEATAADIRVREWLSRFGPLGGEGGPVATRFGVKLGSRCPARSTPMHGHAPILTGSDLFPYSHGQPRRFARIDRASDPSLWSHATWGDADQRFAWSELHSHRTANITASAEIGITTTACLLDRTRIAAQNTVVLAEWRDGAAAPGALTALLNSSLARWYAFVFLRAGVAGGGRRDYHIYPRTIDALPCPALDDEWTDGLAGLVEAVTDVARLAAPLDLELWDDVLDGVELGTTLAAWPVTWSEWPENIGLSAAALDVEREQAGPLGLEGPSGLRLTKSLRVSSEDGDLLDFLAIYLPAAAEAAGRLTREEVQALRVPDRTAVRGLLQRHGNALVARDRAREEYLRLVDEIDEAVFDAFEMPDRLRRIIRRRMRQFPLSENAARPRLPWEPTRKPTIKLFEPGGRYH